MLCEDRESMSRPTIHFFAEQQLYYMTSHVRFQILKRLQTAFGEDYKNGNVLTVLACGSGEFFANHIFDLVFATFTDPLSGIMNFENQHGNWIRGDRLCFSKLTNMEISSAAPAYAVSVLAIEERK
jgi:uncharacterized hydantoinase/oxoprolinase family protein